MLVVKPDDLELDGDGRDATRVVLAATDRFGNLRPFASGAIQLSVTGPGEIVGENPFSLSGGRGRGVGEGQGGRGHHPAGGAAPVSGQAGGGDPRPQGGTGVGVKF